MKIFQSALLTVCAYSSLFASTTPNIYVEELNAFKNSPDYKLIFDEDANTALRIIERDIVNCKNLSWLQRYIRSAFLSLDAIVVTPKTMPQLYSYVESICKESGIKTPTVFLTTEKGFFNAAAQKLLMSSGAIIVGQKLLLEISTKELEAVVAHEIGHIKHNHANKTIAMNYVALMSTLAGLYYIINKQTNDPVKSMIASGYFGFPIALTAVSFFINKRFEKEADEFAYKFMNKGEGLIKFFEHLQEKVATEDANFDRTRAKLTTNQLELSMYSYAGLSTSYYLAKLGHNIGKAYSWIYHNTPLGAHPSLEARIKAAQDYIDSQAAAAA